MRILRKRNKFWSFYLWKHSSNFYLEDRYYPKPAQLKIRHKATEILRILSEVPFLLKAAIVEKSAEWRINSWTEKDCHACPVNTFGPVLWKSTVKRRLNTTVGHGYTLLVLHHYTTDIHIKTFHNKTLNGKRSKKWSDASPLNNVRPWSKANLCIKFQSYQ